MQKSSQRVALIRYSNTTLSVQYRSSWGQFLTRWFLVSGCTFSSILLCLDCKTLPTRETLTDFAPSWSRECFLHRATVRWPFPLNRHPCIILTTLKYAQKKGLPSVIWYAVQCRAASIWAVMISVSHHYTLFPLFYLQLFSKWILIHWWCSYSAFESSHKINPSLHKVNS